MHVDVHEVVDDLALDVVLHPVDKEAASHIHHLDEGQFPGRDNKERASEKQTNKQAGSPWWSFPALQLFPRTQKSLKKISDSDIFFILGE